MDTVQSRRRMPQSPLAPRVIGAFLVGACIGLFAAPASAQTAVFTLQDATNLAPVPYQIYVTGFSTAGPYVLQSDGSWQTPPVSATTTTLPCYRFPQDIQQIQINGAQTAISARVYYFVVTDSTKFPSCNPTSGNGLFNNPNGFTYTYTVAAGMALTTPPASDVIAKSFPAWTFSEIGASASNGTIDLSQVDFFAFPMSTQAAVTAATPANPSQIGNPVGAANPGEAVNHASVRDAFAAYADALALAQGAACSNPSPPAVCEYKKLLQDITTPNSPVPLYVLQNPGGYVTTNTSGPLSTAFDGVIGTLWAPGAPTLTINSGGGFGTTVPQDTFTTSIVTINYPSVPASAYPLRAMKFVGQSSGYIAYVVNPIDYHTGCVGGQIPAPYCSSPSTTGFQVFAGAGALAGPVNNDNYNALSSGGLLSPGATVAADYNGLVARLGLLLSSAMNRGVALVNCTGLQTWQCWQNETYWYPTTVSSTFPDITQNLFSYWMHTAVIKGTPMFIRPPSAVASASGTPGGGKLMGMAYGFAADENPTPPATSPPQPEVPSKLDQTVVYGASGNTITFGPWVTSSLTPTLSVVVVPGTGGTVSSSPAGIACDPTCSRAFAAGTSVTLTATPASGWVFTQWSGACTGTATTCTVTVNATTSVFAQFTQTPPATFGLNVVVSGPGRVASAPAGIDCGAACSAAFASGSLVTLTATPQAGATFASWSGACAGSGATCQVTMSAARNVGATFVAPAQVTLSVASGAGGTVTTVPGGIDCGTTCVAAFALGTQVSVVATPKPGYRFTGWGGACSGTNVCDLVMSGNQSVTASFASVPAGQYALTVIDFGSGTIVSSPPGINCGTACATSFAAGTLVTLTATPSPGYAFAGWGGACTGLGACVVLMDNIHTVDATFLPSAAPSSATAIPTLSQWGLLVLCAAIGVVALAQRPRRRRT